MNLEKNAPRGTSELPTINLGLMHRNQSNIEGEARFTILTDPALSPLTELNSGNKAPRGTL